MLCKVLENVNLDVIFSTDNVAINGVKIICSTFPIETLWAEYENLNHYAGEFGLKHSVKIHDCLMHEQIMFLTDVTKLILLETFTHDIISIFTDEVEDETLLMTDITTIVIKVLAIRLSHSIMMCKTHGPLYTVDDVNRTLFRRNLGMGIPRDGDDALYEYKYFLDFLVHEDISKRSDIYCSERKHQYTVLINNIVKFATITNLDNIQVHDRITNYFALIFPNVDLQTIKTEYSNNHHSMFDCVNSIMTNIANYRYFTPDIFLAYMTHDLL